MRGAQCTKITERNTNRKEETSLIPNSWRGSWEFKQNYSQASKSKALLKLHFHHHSDSSLFWECSPPLILDESFSRKSMKLFTLHLTWGITLLYSSFSWTEKWISISIRNTKKTQKLIELSYFRRKKLNTPRNDFNSVFPKILFIVTLSFSLSTLQRWSGLGSFRTKSVKLFCLWSSPGFPFTQKKFTQIKKKERN